MTGLPYQALKVFFLQTLKKEKKQYFLHSQSSGVLQLLQNAFFCCAFL